MKNVLDFIKDKIYYLMGATIILIILIVLISSCSSGGSRTYSSIEKDMTNAAKEYYKDRKSKLPKEEGSVVTVSLSTLQEAGLIDKTIEDPKNSSIICSGKVEVSKNGELYSYVPYLICKGSYEPEKLNEKIKKQTTDELGNGVYEIDGEYIFRGSEVNNYLTLGGQTYRIIKVDSNGDIKLMLDEKKDEYYVWDSSYNVEFKSNTGITDDYMHSNIRKELQTIYKAYDDDVKGKIVSKTLCYGRVSEEKYDKSQVCNQIQENEKISLLNVSDYINASLDHNCNSVSSSSCKNQNYLTLDEKINTWTLNSKAERNYYVYFISYTGLDISSAANSKKVNPVIYISGNTLTAEGTGTLEKPYVIN